MLVVLLLRLWCEQRLCRRLQSWYEHQEKLPFGERKDATEVVVVVVVSSSIRLVLLKDDEGLSTTLESSGPCLVASCVVVCVCVVCGCV